MTATAEDPRIERTRAVVLEAAAELLGECGFARTTIEAIAERSGVARSTIYRHWPQRPDLLVEAVESYIGDMPAPSATTLREDLIQLFTGLSQRLTDPRIGSMGASLLAEARRDPTMLELHTRFTKRRRSFIESVIQAAVDRGELARGIDVVQMADDMAAPLFYRTLVTHEPLDQDFIEGHVDRWIAIHTGGTI